MRISCPYCGERGVEEFSYRGDATLTRPDPDAPGALAAFVDYAHLRDNRAGWHREYWQHVAGCRSWLVVSRDVRNHAISQVAPAHTAARSEILAEVAS